MIDKNLFLYDLAVVAILKNEGHYLKEWLDYHLAAGVEHFYLYDNDSSDNQAEVAAPYVEAGLVDYFPAPGKVMQMQTYNDAARRFKFQSRYMTFIDGDEFIFPKTRQSIVEVVDEILSHDSEAAGLAINWQTFGSSGEEIADYSRGVLEKFTRRAPKDWTPDGGGNAHVKTIANSRRIKLFESPHVPVYFEGFYSLNEEGEALPPRIFFNTPITAGKIVVNHYHTKSREEYAEKILRGSAAAIKNHKSMENFYIHDRNEEFDDGILKYREAREKIYQPPDRSRALEKILAALIENLQPTLRSTPPEFYAGKTETFLTCRAVAGYLQTLKTKLLTDDLARYFEEAALVAILKSIEGMSFVDARLLLRELPELLSLPYPAAKILREACLDIIPPMLRSLRLNNVWREYIELDYLLRLLKIKELI